MTDDIEEKRQPRYRLTRWSLPWLVLIPILVGYELLMVQQGKMGGPLSHVVWWAYGDRWSLRWWVLSCAVTGGASWTCWHFMMETPGVRELLYLLGAGVIVGLCGWLVTHIA